MRAEPLTRCGTVVLAGEPNAGKSTLLNALVGARLAIVSAKAQSTRQCVVGVLTSGDVQLALIDPPGLLEPQYLLQETMVSEAVGAVRRADAVLHLHRLELGRAPPLASLLPEGILRDQPIATVYTAADRVPAEDWPEPAPSTFLVSATRGDGLADLVTWCRAQVPPGPFRYDPDDLGTQPVRFFAGEFVREAAFELLHEELPYSLAAHVDEFRESSDPVYIRVTLYVERESQKGMVIGANGRTIKSLGALARQHIEALLGARVYLDLWVKVLPRWRTSPHLLRELGFRPPATRKQ
jgi:GTP-binding protein Era